MAVPYLVVMGKIDKIVHHVSAYRVMEGMA